MANDPSSTHPPGDAPLAPKPSRFASDAEGRSPADRSSERAEGREPHGYEGQAYEGLGPTDGEGLDPYYFLRVIHRRRWTAATVFLLVVISATIYTFTVVPVYETRVRVLVEPQRLNIIKIEDVVEERSLDSEVAILQSRWLAGKTLESLGLLGRGTRMSATRREPPATAAGDSFRLGGIWLAVESAVSGLVGDPRPPAGGAGGARPGESTAESAQIDGFLSGLSVTTNTKGVLDVSYRSSDPALAATLANGLAREYIGQNLEMRFVAVKEVTDWLAARLTEQRRKVDASEQALQHYREQNRIDPVEEAANPVLAKLGEFTSEITRAKAARLEKEALYNKARALRANPAVLQRLPRVAADPFVVELRLEVEKLQRDRAQLSERLQDQHPEMIKVRTAIQAAQSKLQTEMDRVVESMREDVSAARTAEATFENAFAAQKRDALAQNRTLNRKGVELGILEREAQSNRQIYDMLTQRARETNIAKEIKPNEIRILDPAEVPRVPLWPKKERNILIAILAGIGLAVGLAFGFEQLDHNVKTPDEITGRLGLPLMGFVPEVPAKDPRNNVPLMNNGAPPAFIEAVRSLRTSVLFSFTDEGLKVVAITSAGMGEGKTVVASNLGIALAQAGQRVLLIDADLRRPVAHRLFHVPREPGLSNLLVGNAKAGEAVRRTAVPNLWLLPAGHRSPSPPELLGSPRFKKFLATFADRFDWVLIDTPPTMPVTDACVVGHVTSGVLLVVGADRVSRHAARRAVDQLAAAGAHVSGAVLTRVDLHRNPYYYSPYYHRKYSRYYTDAGSD